jgi:hypothetical protein
MPRVDQVVLQSLQIALVWLGSGAGEICSFFPHAINIGGWCFRKYDCQLGYNGGLACAGVSLAFAAIMSLDPSVFIGRTPKKSGSGGCIGKRRKGRCQAL